MRCLRIDWLVALACSALAVACRSKTPTVGANDNDELAAAELHFRAGYAATPIAVRGSVLSITGKPIVGARLELGDNQTTSDARGRFEFRDLPRNNTVLVATAPGLRVERRPLHLMQPLDEQELQLMPLLMVPSEGARLVFGGDVQLGRRFVDTDESTAPSELPRDDPDALILASDPEPGARSVVRFLRSELLDADFVSVNLETVVTDTPRTPDTDNSYVFFTLPGTLPALRWAGIDYCSLGNNHIYDYLDDGLRDTLSALDHAGLAHSGAGLDAEEAFQAHRQAVAGSDFGFLSVVSIEGIPVRNQSAATDERSGSADLNDDARIRTAFEREREAGHTPIAAVHTGYEYTESPPDDYTVDRMHFVVDAGAALVVGHHPHVPQGFQFYEGVLVAHSLGNLAFDQERLETVFGLLLTVDLAGETLLHAEARAVFIENLVPKPIAGSHHGFFQRRIAASSSDALVVPYAESLLIAPSGRADDFVALDRDVELDVRIDDSGFAVIDLRPLLEPGESLRKLTASVSTLDVRVGRDLLVFGDMEDTDVDDDVMEPSIWYTTGLDRALSSFPCQKDAYRGAVALCSIRQATSKTEASMSIRNRVRVLGDKVNLPNKELTLLAYVSGENAGPVRAEVTYHASFGERDFGSQEAFRLPRGNYPWHPVVSDLKMPADSSELPREPDDPYDPVLRTDNARSFRIFFHHGAPRSGAGVFRVDDVAAIAWEEDIDPSGETKFDTPHPRDFLRIEGGPGNYRLSIELRKLLPRAVADE